MRCCWATMAMAVLTALVAVESPLAWKLACAPQDTWVAGEIVTERKERGELRVAGQQLTFRRRAGDEERSVPLAELRDLAFEAPRHKVLRAADRAFKANAFPEAKTLYEEAAKELGDDPHLRCQLAACDRASAALGHLQAPVVPSGTLDAGITWCVATGESRLPSGLKKVIEAAWDDAAGLAEPARRSAWQDHYAALGLKLEWDEAAPALLATAIATAAGDDAGATVKAFAAARDARAGFTDQAWSLYGKALLEEGDEAAAGAALGRLSGPYRQRPEVYELLVRLGVKAPPLAPTLLACTYVGLAGEQYISEVGFAADGTIWGAAPNGAFKVAYSADGQRCLGVEGDAATVCDGGKREFAVQLTRKNPFDGTSWGVGYKQVHGILQQPYVQSPHGWKWWGWSHTEAKARELMADSRGVDIFFPAPNRFIAWTWRDGGNSVITRDPRDLAQKNSWTHRGGGSASYFMLGACDSGEPLGGVAFAHRPGDACSDSYGRFYVAQQVEGHGDKLLFDHGGGAGFTICDADLSVLAHGNFGAGGSIAIAVRDRFLVIGGSSKGALPTRNALQERPGGDGDGFLAIIALW